MKRNRLGVSLRALSPPPPKRVGGKPTAPTAAKPGDKPAGDKGGGGSEAESMMKMMQEMSAPGKEHEALKPLVGAFTCSTKFYSGPGDPPQEAAGTVERQG